MSVEPEPTAHARHGRRVRARLRSSRLVRRPVPPLVLEEDWDGTAMGTGIERPETRSFLAPYELVRSFAFLDLCGFTAYTDKHGPALATEVLTAFRHVTRQVAARRGVRVAKWLGDGVMLVGVEPGPLVAAVVEIVSRADTDTLGVRAGITTGEALLFDGDDYVGRVLNVAARMCDTARRNEVLADQASVADLPAWMRSEPYRTVQLRGVGRLDTLVSVELADDVEVEVIRLAGPDG